MMDGGGGRSIVRLIGVRLPGTRTGEKRPDNSYWLELSCFWTVGFSVGDCHESLDLPAEPLAECDATAKSS